MKRKHPRDATIRVEEKPARYQPDPHRRGRIIENKKIYSRKASSKAAGPFDCLG